MGTAVCVQCKKDTSQIEQPVFIPVGSSQDPDQPEHSYAYPESVNFNVPCAVTHPITQMPEINVSSSVERGRKFQNSYYIAPYSVYYTGQWKRGRPHGVGDIVFQNGSILRGTFYKGRVKGEDCILILEDGSYYRGNIQNNQFFGKGTFKQQTGHTYQGQWNDNVPNGNGRETFANGDFYLGSFVNGAKKGKNGKYVWKNHPEFLQYQGQFQNDYMQGNGILRKINGTQIRGIFRKNTIQQAFIKNKQYQYKGSIKNGLIQGKGKMIFLSEKKQYEGNFKNGQPHGFGTVSYQNGDKKSGNWFQGYFIRDSKGLSQDQMQKCIILIQNQLSKKSYYEDAIQSINSQLNSYGLKNIQASSLQISNQTKPSGQKYLIVDVGNKSILIKSKN